MKASEVIKKYAAGERNFQRVNLQGQSFRGKNLSEADFTEADFSKADLRSTNFTGANLRKANFTEARCGLQNRWAAILTILFCLTATISGLSPFFTASTVFLLFDTSSLVNQAMGLANLIAIVMFLIVIIRQGTRAGIFALATAIVAILLLAVVGGIAASLIAAPVGEVVGAAGTVAIAAGIVAAGAVAVGLSVASAIAVAGAGAGILAGAGGIVTALIAALISGVTGAAGGITAAILKEAETGAGTGALARAISGGVFEKIAAVGGIIVLALVVVAAGAYTGWRAMKDDFRDFWMRRLAIAIAATGGTSFYGADLTEANFTKTKFKSTNLTEANLTRTLWRDAQRIDFVRPGQTYLNISSLRHLLITGAGQGKNFDRQDLRGVNISEANLENASFVDTDFYQSNLQRANLSRAILVRSNFERADLRNATLTGSCIQDWVITESTKLDGIICDYVYLKWIDGDKRDQMPPRGKFKPGGFVTFVRYILETVELYHEKDINPRLALTVLQKMSRDYDEPLDIVALGKKGERVFIQVKVSENINRENFKDEYHSRYDTDLKLWSGNIHQLPPTVDSFIEKRISKIASGKTDDFVFVDAIYVEGNYTEINQGEANMTGDRNIEIKKGNYNENIQGDYYEQSGNFGIGHMSGGEIKEGAKVAGVINEAQKQNLADAAQEIQQLLEQLSETYPTTTSREKMTVVGEVVDRIEGNPPLKAKVINALKAGGTEAFKEAIDHPLVNIFVATIEGWQDAE